MYLHALQAECCFGFLFVFSTGLEPGTSYMLGKHPTTGLYPQHEPLSF